MNNLILKIVLSFLSEGFAFLGKLNFNFSEITLYNVFFFLVGKFKSICRRGGEKLTSYDVVTISGFSAKKGKRRMIRGYFCFKQMLI